MIKRIIASLIVIVVLSSFGKEIQAQSIVSSTTDIDYGTCIYRLPFESCNPSTGYSGSHKAVNYTNVHEEPEYSNISTNIRRISIINSNYNFNQAFTVSHPQEGYQHMRTFQYDTFIPYGEVRTNYIWFNPKAKAVESCVQNKNRNCEVTTRVSIIPSYCNTATGQCMYKPEINVNVRAMIQIAIPEPSFSTNVIDFGDVKVGDTKQITMTVTNNSMHETYEFYSPVLSGDFSVLNLGSIRSLTTQGHSTNITFIFTPTQEGTQIQTVYLPDRRPKVFAFTQLGEKITITGTGYIEETTIDEQTPVEEPGQGSPVTPTSSDGDPEQQNNTTMPTSLSETKTTPTSESSSENTATPNKTDASTISTKKSVSKTNQKSEAESIDDLTQTNTQTSAVVIAPKADPTPTKNKIAQVQALQSTGEIKEIIESTNQKSNTIYLILIGSLGLLGTLIYAIYNRSILK